MSKSLTQKELFTNIDAFVSSVRSIGIDCHVLLMQVMYYILDESHGGDVSPATRLLKKIQFRKTIGDKTEKHAVIRTDAVKAWLEEFACVRAWSEETGFKLNSAKVTHARANLKEWTKRADKTKWNAFTPEKAYVRFDLPKAIDHLYKLANEKATTPGPKGELNWSPAQLRDKLRELKEFAEQFPMPKDYKVTPAPSADTVTLPETPETGAALAVNE